MILICMTLLPSYAAEACEELEQVRVQLNNDAGISPGLLTTAVREASWILSSLCVQLTSPLDGRSEDLEIHILPDPLTDATKTSCLGLALPTFDKGNHGAVFMSNVNEIVAEHGDLIDAKTLLGLVLAHEIGHLLLRTKTHSTSGVMQANFGPLQLRMAYQRRLTFTKSDRRAVLRNRHVAETLMNARNCLAPSDAGTNQANRSCNAAPVR